MSDFPLSPFLASLATDGIQLTISDYARLHHVLQTGGDWTITRLRDTLLALLAHDADQQELFLRRFNDFFAPSLTIDDAVAALDLQQVLADLKRLAAEQDQVAPRSQPIFSLPTISLPTLPRPPKPQFGFWTLWSILLILGVLTVSYFLLPFVRPSLGDKPLPTSIATVTPLPVSVSEPKPVSPRKRLYTDVPYIAKISYEPLTTWEAWQRDAGLAAFFFFAALLYGLYLWRSHKIPEDEAPSYNPDGPRHFPLGSIGGQPAPLLSDATLNELADCMGYFQSDESGHRLDVPTSIQATMRKGGVPALTFHKRQQLRSLLILEDDFAEALTWNSLARELAAGMTRLGVPVVYGRFHGSPAQFKTPDGLVHRLEDLEDQRRGYLLLIFTDGKSLQRQTSTFALEALARWPMVAWMELREPRAWDESTTLPAHYGIPLYPATPAGAFKAVRRFLTEHGAEVDYARNEHSWHGLPSQAGTQTDAYIEQLLGDALMWAQDCAMFQPISPGLADALRRAFHPNLPAERIERLYELPDTQYDVAGLRFSADVLRVLRTGFLVRRTEAEQEKVLRFLVQEIEKAEPTAENSLAHLAWEAVKERVRLELEQDAALARLAKLAKTPIGPAISASLDGFGFYEDGNQATTTPKIPLRIKPNNRYAWQRLARIADSFNIPKLAAYPIALGHQLAIGLLVVLFLGSSSLSLKNYLSPALPEQNWRVMTSEETYAMLESKDIKTGKWSMEKSGELHTLTTLPLQPEQEYQALLYGTGYKTINRISVKNHQMVVVLLQTKAEEAYCKEEPPDSGLIVQRCSESSSYGYLVKQATWRGKLGYTAPRGRLMSIGLEIVDYEQNDRLLGLRNLLLDTSSIDIIYRIQPDPSGKWPIDKAIQYIYEDLGPMIERSQLIWWTDDEVPITPNLNNLISNFDRNLKLSDRADFSWTDRVIELLEHHSSGLVVERDIMEKLGKAITQESNEQIVLISELDAVAMVNRTLTSVPTATPIPLATSIPALMLTLSKTPAPLTTNTPGGSFSATGTAAIRLTALYSTLTEEARLSATLTRVAPLFTITPQPTNTPLPSTNTSVPPSPTNTSTTTPTPNFAATQTIEARAMSTIYFVLTASAIKTRTPANTSRPSPTSTFILLPTTTAIPNLLATSEALTQEALQATLTAKALSTPSFTSSSKPTSTRVLASAINTPTPELSATAQAGIDIAVKATLTTLPSAVLPISTAISTPFPTAKPRSTASPTTIRTNTPLPTRSLLTATQTVTPTKGVKLSGISGSERSCNAIISELSQAINRCSEINSNWVCVGREPVEFTPVKYRAFEVGDRRPLSVLNNINVGEGGVLLMNLQVEGQSDPIKLIVVGSASAETNIFTIGVKDNQYICGATPPGMVVQTAEGVGGVVTVNGIDIELH